MSKLTRPPKWP